VKLATTQNSEPIMLLGSLEALPRESLNTPQLV
jgi:hypothetical protein